MPCVYGEYICTLYVYIFICVAGTGNVFTINKPRELMECLKDADGKKLVSRLT